jgi:uncharacterized membrane protein
MPEEQIFEFDPDEGINLIKALLYSEGFSLYKQIWSDQPPLFTILLSYWLRLFGQSVFTARLLTVLFSALLVWSFYQTLRLSLGNLLAFVGTFFLATSTYFLQLSVSVMIGLPSLSLAMLSVYTLMLYKQKTYNYLIIFSGCLLALSLQIKFFTVFLIPVLISLILINKDSEGNKGWNNPKVISSISLWLFSIFCVYIFINILCKSTSYEYLFKVHIRSDFKETIKLYRGYTSLWDWLFLRDYNITVFALIGILVIFIQKRWEGLFPLIWLATAVLLLLNHQPVWYHHYHLLSIPLCWLAAYGTAPIFRLFQQKSFSYYFNSLNVRKLIISSLLPLLFMLSLVRVYTKVVDEIPDLTQESYRQFKIVNLLLKNKSSNQWIFTDRPIYAFYAGLQLPPEIAVFSSKRLVTGNLTSSDLLRVLQSYHPQQIILSRFKQAIESNKAIAAYINERYTKSYEDNSTSYYLLKNNQKLLNPKSQN